MKDLDDSELESQDEQAALQLIEAMLTLRGVSRRELDRRIGKSEGYITQVLGGFVGLRFKLLARIVRALDFEPWVFFATVFSRPRGTILDRDPTAMEHILEVLTAMSHPPRRVARPVATASFMELLPRVQAIMTPTVARAKAERDKAKRRGSPERPEGGSAPEDD